MKTSLCEVIKLLENAIDCNTTDKKHSGYTAKEIHRKCLKLLLEIKTNETHNKISSYDHWGWGTTKGE